MLRRHRYVFGRFDCKAGFRRGSEPCAEAHFSCLSVLSGSCEGPSPRFVPAFDEDDVGWVEVEAAVERQLMPGVVVLDDVARDLPGRVEILTASRRPENGYCTLYVCELEVERSRNSVVPAGSVSNPNGLLRLEQCCISPTGVHLQSGVHLKCRHTPATDWPCVQCTFLIPPQVLWDHKRSVSFRLSWHTIFC